jgi:hypothetical protein
MLTESPFTRKAIVILRRNPIVRNPGLKSERSVPRFGHRSQTSTGLLDLLYITLGIGRAESVRKIIEEPVQFGLSTTARELDAVIISGWLSCWQCALEAP